MRGFRNAVVLLAFVLSLANASFAQEAETVEDAFRNGSISGTIGSYFESVNRDADNADDGWATAYLTLKYETLSWNQLTMGTRFFAHGQLYSDDDNGVTDPFDVDVESQFTLPELYLNYDVTDDTSLRAGRWNHQKITHFDDNQSEGAYVRIKEIEDLDLVAGVMRRFAEIDYDDGEDFGRNNDAQDLDSETTYGPGSSAFLYFLEANYDGIEMIHLNPYFMYHGDYASVYGIDSKVETQIEDSELTLGSKFNYYHVDADIAGSEDANNFLIMPFAEWDPVYFSVGYVKFDDGMAMNKPAWLRDDFMPLVDQKVAYGATDSEVLSGMLKLTFGDFWTHFSMADSNYAMSSSLGDGAQEYEFQFGYKFFKKIDLNARYMVVQFDNVDDKDYKKIETRLRYKF